MQSPFLLQQQFINQILHGDALEKLKEIPNESIDCIVTSPPYWALRDYKVDGQIGVEKTIDEYIDKLVDVFTEAKRVLKKEGTCWVVLGDTYAGNRGEIGKIIYPKKQKHKDFEWIKKRNTEGISEKSLCLIPERFAIKMIDKGWILRNKIIWWKPNCMPSSAKDRFTVDFENIYFFTKSKKYYFKTQYEPMAEESKQRYNYNFGGGKKYQELFSYRKDAGCWKNPNPRSYSENGRIKRSVWRIPPVPFPEAHFAVYPEQLVKQCLDAGCPSPDGIVLDPFMGAGTTALTALKNNMRFVGIELNKDYIDIANKRIQPYVYQSKLIP